MTFVKYHKKRVNENKKWKIHDESRCYENIIYFVDFNF